MKILILLFSVIYGGPEARAETYYLAPGDSQKIAAHPGAIKIKGKKSIVVVDRGRHLHLTALQPGEVTLTMGTQVDTVYVVPRTQLEFFKAVQNLLRNFMGLKAHWRQDRIVISGRLHRLSDWQDLAVLAEEHSATYSLAASWDEDIKPEVQTWLQERLRVHSLSTPLMTHTPVLRALISEDLKNQDTLWATALEPLGIERRYEKSQVAVEPLVRVRIVVAEVNKKVQKQLGVEWPQMLQATILPKLAGPDSLDVFLKMLEQKGLGQILASPNLLARSGAEADFLAGGEFGIKIATARTKEVIWKRHGIYLKIKPRADRSGRMSIELSTEISLLDGAHTVDGIPGLKTNRMATHFDLTQARTVILSGLIRNDWGEENQGVAGLASLPILGDLFRSKNFYANKTELVIFVTPEIVEEPDAAKPVDSSLPKNLLPNDWKADP